jgi:hypothetical protein
MATYKITAPDGQSYNVNAPDSASQDEVMAYAQRNFNMLAKDKKPETTLAKEIAQGVGNVAAGLVRGAGSIGATLMRPFDTASENEQRRKSMDDALQSFGAEPDSLLYKGGKLGGELAGTAGAGGLIAKPLTMIAPKLAQAVATSGFSLGSPAATTLAGKAADMGTRMIGGAVTGGASAGMVGDSMGMGAAVGGALPPTLKGAGLVGQTVGRGVMSMLTPQQQKMAAQIATMTGQKIEDVLSAVQKQGPSILNIKPTVPQILQDPTVSQLQRSVINAGDTSLMARETAQNAERLAGFNRIAPVFGTVNEAADNAGNLIGEFGKAARTAESKRVNRLFDAVDPFGDTSIELPIDALKAAKAKYMGEGSFMGGGNATNAINAAESIGTQVIDAVKPMTQKAVGKSQSLEQAVRSAGGIRGGAGELRDLGIKQSGTTGLVNNKSGKAADLLAEDMYQRGFIPDNDPATLFDYLRNGNGRKVFANDATEGGFQGAMERSMGDAPASSVVPKPVPFSTVQNFRSSLNEAWKDASMAGKNQEAAALKEMISQIDSKVESVAAGGGNIGEKFPADIVDTWKEALAAHAKKKQRFDTGPQAQMFRKGGDGMALIQGAEIPGMFFSGRTSQIEDAQAFNKLIAGNSDLSKALKSYAVTDAANQVTKDGVLSASKLPKWADSRSGAINETFSAQDKALLNEIVQGVKAADSAATGGMSKGSNTDQNRQAAARLLSNGLVDSPATNFLFRKIPLGGSALDAMRKASSESKAVKLGGLLSDPELFSAELQKFLARQKPGKVAGLLSDPRASLAAQLGYRAAPVVMGD